MAKSITVYTDGGCTGNPGAGGWAAIVVIDGKEVELSGGAKASTNNRMELQAAISAFEYVKTDLGERQFKIVTDSQYLMNGMTKWLDNWVRKNWKAASGKPVLNKDLWEALLAYKSSLDIEWEWVKGHSGHPYNERCDELVAVQRTKFA